MKAYSKGVRAERELLYFLNHKGFSVCRVPSSGGFLSPVDIVALKKGLILAIECKAHSSKPRLAKKQLASMRAWCDKAGAVGLIGWRTTGKWLFLRLEDAETGKYDDENWMEMEHLFDALDYR